MTLPFAAVAVALALAACARTPAARAPELRARLVDTGDVELTWTGGRSDVAGAWVELATPGSDFVKLDALAPGVTRYRHPDVAPGTTFVYRLRPYVGAATQAVTVETGAEPDRPGDDSEGPLPDAAPAPAGLSARLAAPTQVALRWPARGAREDGVLVELSLDGADYRVVALLPPGTRSFRKTRLPAHARVHFRVRPFVYAETSTIAAVTTPS